MHAISSYRDNRPTHTYTYPQTHKQTGPITIHCAASSAQCKYVNIIGCQLRNIRYFWFVIKQICNVNFPYFMVSRVQYFHDLPISLCAEFTGDKNGKSIFGSCTEVFSLQSKIYQFFSESNQRSAWRSVWREDSSSRHRRNPARWKQMLRDSMWDVKEMRKWRRILL